MARTHRIMAATAAAFIMGAGAFSAVTAHESEGAMSEISVTAALRALPVPQGGLYTVRSELVDFFIPDLSEKEMAEARSTVAGFFPEGQSVCLSPEEAAGLTQQAIPVVDQELCRITHFSVKGSQFDAQGICQSDQGGTSYIATSGSMTEDGFVVTTEMKDTPNDADGVMKIKLEATRAGDC